MAAVADVSVPGFNQSLKISRQAGNANLAAINVGQAIETFDALRCQGQTVTLSFWAKAGANYSGGLLNVKAISGAGVNQSAASLIAGTWTGQSAVISAQQALSSAMTRYQFTGAVPLNTTQLGILLSFAPSGTAGADDSISINGVQLEIGASASPFERIDAQVVLEICQRYAWAISEPAAGVVIGAGRQYRRLGAALLYGDAGATLPRADRRRRPRIVQDDPGGHGHSDDDHAGRDAYAQRHFDQRRLGRNDRPGDPADRRRRIGLDRRQFRLLGDGPVRRFSPRPVNPPQEKPMNIAQTTQETLGLMKELLAKNVTVSTGLTAYDLQAPAKNLYPIVTPLRNSLPRVARLNPGDAARWRSIIADHRLGLRCDGLGSGRPALGEHVLLAHASVTAPYVTLGEEDTVTFEAEAAAQGFEDINATATLRILQKTMRKEETALLGGNTSLALGTPGRADAQRLGHGRDAAGRDLFGHRRRADLRRLPQFERSPAASRRRRRSPATTATPTR